MNKYNYASEARYISNELISIFERRNRGLRGCQNSINNVIIDCLDGITARCERELYHDIHHTYHVVYTRRRSSERAQLLRKIRIELNIANNEREQPRAFSQAAVLGYVHSQQ